MYFTISKDASILQTQSSNNSLQVFIDNGTAYTEQTSYTYTNETSYTYNMYPSDNGRSYLRSMSAEMVMLLLWQLILVIHFRCGVEKK